MRQIEFTPIRISDNAEIYSYKIDNDKLSEFHKFVAQYKDTTDRFLANDFQRIAQAINRMATDGVLERFFRNEGHIRDRVYAIPLEIIRRDKSKHGTLRVYCIRVSDTLLIVGGGGLKTTDNYDVDTALSAIVETLQAIDAEFMSLEDDGVIIENEVMNLKLYIE